MFECFMAAYAADIRDESRHIYQGVIVKKVISTIIILVIIVGAAAFVYFNAKNQYDVLDSEAQKIKVMDIDEDSVDMTLKCSGDYMAVEETMKEYISSYLDEVKDFKNEINDEKINSILSVESISADMPEFTSSYAYISDKRSSLEDSENVIIEMSDKDNILKQIDDQGVSTFQQYIYKKVMLDTIGTAFYYKQDTLDSARSALLTKLDSIEAVLNFLKENNGHWSINETMLQFENEDLLNQYQTLVAAIG